MAKSYTLDENEVKLLLRFVLENSGLGNSLNEQQKQELIDNTFKNLMEAGVELNRDNIVQAETQKALRMALTATFAKDYALKNNLEFDFDFRLLFKDKQVLTPEEKKELDSLEKISELVLQPKNIELLIDKLAKEFANDQPAQNNAQRPKFKMMAVFDDAGTSKIEDIGVVAQSSKGQPISISLSSVVKNNAVGEIKHLEETHFLEGVSKHISDSKLDTLAPTLFPH